MFSYFYSFHCSFILSDAPKLFPLLLPLLLLPLHLLCLLPLPFLLPLPLLLLLCFIFLMLEGLTLVMLSELISSEEFFFFPLSSKNVFISPSS